LLLGIIVTLILLIVVLVRAGAAVAPTSNFPILNNAKTKGVEDEKQMERALRLGEALKIETISYELGRQNFEAFPVLHDYLKNCKT
jgi:hypothetical protein